MKGVVGFRFVRFCRDFLFGAACLLLFPVSADAGDSLPDTCRFFYDTLAQVPHDRLEQKEGLLKSMYDGSDYSGCEVDFKSRELLMGSSERLPEFYPGKDSTLYEQGWRPDLRYTGDGPGSGIHGIVRPGVLCLVAWDQHAWINDDGRYEQSELINMTVQCMPVPQTTE